LCFFVVAFFGGVTILVKEIDPLYIWLMLRQRCHGHQMQLI